MSSCPTHEKLRDLLADALTASEFASISRHVEGCDSCQEKLAGLAGFPDTEAWRLAEHPPGGSRAEARMLASLKQMPSLLVNTVRAGTPSSTDESPHAAPETKVTSYGSPEVPGYEILGELGRGGMGIVYRARQLGLDRTVALKMIRSGIHAGPKDLERFRAESAALARLQHPNIVQIYDVGETAGRPYFVLEFVAGGSLAQQLRGKPQPAKAAAELVETLARAVQAAHANGVIHRDLKPGNILLQKVDSRRSDAESGPDSSTSSSATDTDDRPTARDASSPPDSRLLSIAFFPKITD